jgi:hypothetical protein
MRARTHRAILVLLVLMLLVMGALGACGTSAVGVDVCDEIETARCQRAAALGNCGVDFEAPYADATGGTSSAQVAQNAATCTRFYGVACLHGLETPYVPGASSTLLRDCLWEIEDATNCAVITNPTEAGVNCAWLADTGPPDTGVTDSGSTDVTVTTDVIDTGKPPPEDAHEPDARDAAEDYCTFPIQDCPDGHTMP